MKIQCSLLITSFYSFRNMRGGGFHSSRLVIEYSKSYLGKNLNLSKCKVLLDKGSNFN